MKHEEDDAQAMVMHWARLQRFADGFIADYMHHSPNGGKRNMREAVRLKNQGVMAGFPDLFLFVARSVYGGLFIEMKSNNGKVSSNQAAVMQRLAEQGYKCVVCKGFEAARTEITNYLKG
jgi:VRR-NUC domain